MEIILMVLMVFAAVFAIGYPLVNARRYQMDSVASGDDQFEKLSGERDKVFDALRDFEFDHATGKLSDADYQSLRSRYEVKAAAILQQLDALEAALPKRNAQPLRGKQGSKLSCPRCHSRVEVNDHFCLTCGAKL
jgi:hypothetical protein